MTRNPAGSINGTDTSMIECIDLYGQRIKVPREKIILRPAVYAIIVKDSQILLVKMKSTGKYHYYNPSGKAYHGLHYYYLCRPLSERVIADVELAEESAEIPSWVPIEGLRAEDFQAVGAKVIKLLKSLSLELPT